MFNSFIINKMKKFLLLSTITAIAAGSFISCSQNDDEISPLESRKEVNFSSNIIKVTPPATRAAGDIWHENDSIGIFMFEEATTNVVEGMSNVKYTTATGGETGSFTAANKVIYFPDNSDKVRFMSYYPYTANLVGNTYKVDVSVQTNQPAIDLLYSFDTNAKYDKTTPDKKVSLVFDHMLTKININVKPGDGLEVEDLENIIVTLEGFNTKADFDLISGTFIDISDVNIITPLVITAKNGYVVSSDAIIIPTANPSSAKIVFNLNNGVSEEIKNDIFTWTFKDKALENGYEYVYDVTVKRSGIVVEATINDWTTGDPEVIDAE